MASNSHVFQQRNTLHVRVSSSEPVDCTSEHYCCKLFACLSGLASRGPDPDGSIHCGGVSLPAVLTLVSAVTLISFSLICTLGF